MQGGDLTADIARKLETKATTTGKTSFWVGETGTFTGAEGAGADAETTGLACYALVKYGHAPAITTSALAYLAGSRSSYGGWGSTQSTVWTLKALQAAATMHKTMRAGSVTVSINGQAVKTVKIDGSNNDILQQIDVTPSAHKGHNTLSLQYNGAGAVDYQIVGQYYMPWNQTIAGQTGTPESMSLKVVYDKTVLTPMDTVIATMTARNITNKPVRMPLLDIGTPPGFDIDRDTLETAVKSGDISKYTLSDSHLVVYLETLKANEAMSLKYRMHPRSAMKALMPASRAYPYYNPGSLYTFGPQLLEVREMK